MYVENEQEWSLYNRWKREGHSSKSLRLFLKKDKLNCGSAIDGCRNLKYGTALSSTAFTMKAVMQIMMLFEMNYQYYRCSCRLSQLAIPSTPMNSASTIGLLPQVQLDHDSFLVVKRKKERITCLVCRNADGSDQIAPLVRGSSRKPRYFRDMRSTEHGLHYRSNKKAWMTRIVFYEWLNNFN